jgi:pyruvate formate lyase activating enzyme
MRHKALLWESAGDKKVRCSLCAHRCVITDGSYGFCGMRHNEGGVLYTFAYGEVIANHVDPIEKKPLYHFLPGSYAYSIATIGCNFRCDFCQNWSISQISKRNGDFEGYELKPEEVVREALKHGCQSISYTYTEPTIFFEYAYDTAKAAKEAGLSNTFVTNGYMTKEAIGLIAPVLDAANVDLKFFDDDTYRQVCKGHLEPVLDSIRNLKQAGIWVEVTTLVIPGRNDSDEELKGIAEFIAGVDAGIPWHVSRFHPDYKFTEAGATPMKTMEKARAIGVKAGLKYIYLGNVSPGNDTVCPGCAAVLVERSGFSAVRAKAFQHGTKCMECGSKIAGVWESAKMAKEGKK